MDKVRVTFGVIFSILLFCITPSDALISFGGRRGLRFSTALSSSLSPDVERAKAYLMGGPRPTPASSSSDSATSPSAHTMEATEAESATPMEAESNPMQAPKADRTNPLSPTGVEFIVGKPGPTWSGPTGTSFLPEDTVARCENGSPVEKAKMAKDPSNAFNDVSKQRSCGVGTSPGYNHR